MHRKFTVDFAGYSPNVASTDFARKQDAIRQNLFNVTYKYLASVDFAENSLNVASTDFTRKQDAVRQFNVASAYFTGILPNVASSDFDEKQARVPQLLVLWRSTVHCFKYVCNLSSESYAGGSVAPTTWKVIHGGCGTCVRRAGLGKRAYLAVLVSAAPSLLFLERTWSSSPSLFGVFWLQLRGASSNFSSWITFVCHKSRIILIIFAIHYISIIF